MERRTLIIGAVAGGIGLVEYAFTSRWMNGMRDPAALSVKAYERFGPQAALMAITPNDEFSLTSKGPAPAVDRDKWQINFDGLVEHPFTLNFQDLLKLPRIEKVYTLECISDTAGGAAPGNAKWTGTPLKPLLERATP